MLSGRYAKLYEEFYTQRDKIVAGEYEPTDAEAKFVLDAETAVDALADELKDKASLEKKEGSEGETRR